MNSPVESQLESRIGDAYAAHQGGQLELAEQRYRAVLADHPKQVDTLFLLSSLLLRTQPAEALALAGRAVEAAAGAGGIGVSAAALHDHYAACLAASGGDPALEAAQLALAGRLDGGTPERLFRLADAQRRAGDRDAAMATLQAYLAARPGDLNARTNLGALQFQCGLLTESVDSLQAVLQAEPAHAQALNNLGNAFSQLGWLDRAVEQYQQAVGVRPDFADAWFNLAGALHTQSRFDDALPAYQRALALNPQDQRASDGLNGLYVQVVPRWHFVMMNDRARNEAYDQAISRQVGRHVAAGAPPLVLDIGAGSGLLSMMAARAGAAAVVTCEMVRPVAEQAQQIIARNGYADRVTLHDVKSTRLSVGRELPRRADLLVTEIFDVGLLGEYVLPVLAHARRNLLAAGATLVPYRARVWMMPIESVEIHQSFQVDNRNGCGFDLESFNLFAKRAYEQLAIRRYAHTALAAPVAVLDFDFAEDIPDRSVDLEIVPTASGVVHAWVFWFTLYLDQQTEFDTGPYSADTCWAQAVQIESARPALSVGVPVSVTAIQTQSNIRFALTPPGSGVQ